MRVQLLLLSVFCFVLAEANEVETIDTASYALGDVTVRAMMSANDLPFEVDKASSIEFFRGIEENIGLRDTLQDSISNVSFGVGAMQAIFLMDGLEHNKNKDKIPFHCIIEGLNKVVNDELTLPEDTIAIQEYMHQFPDENDPIDLPEEERCKFFTYYGIMKGLQRGLQEYICEMTGKTKEECPSNNKFYALGFMSILESMEARKTPYGYGKYLVLSIIMDLLPFDLENESFMDGCRAALGLDERKLTIAETDRICAELFEDVGDDIQVESIE
jgi:hypothetical protein